MWFSKKDKLGKVPPHLRGGKPESLGQEKPSLYRIEYDMMKKGSILQRYGKPIRQFAVTVNMSTHVVTSGDLVDKKVYEALILAGAVDAPRDIPQPGATGE